MNPPAFDELLQRLVGAKVDFVLVGGLAVNAWGVVRGTKDVDVVVNPDPENLTRLAETAVAAGGHVQAEEMLAGSPASIAALLGSGDRVVIETRLGVLDVIQGMPGVPGYEELSARATQTTILGAEINVCGLDDLRAMKRAAGRTRDLADLEDLDAARGEE